MTSQQIADQTLAGYQAARIGRAYDHWASPQWQDGWLLWHKRHD